MKAKNSVKKIQNPVTNHESNPLSLTLLNDTYISGYK